MLLSLLFMCVFSYCNEIYCSFVSIVLYKSSEKPLLLQGIRFCLLCTAKSGNVAVFQLNIFNCSEVEDLLSSKK